LRTDFVNNFCFFFEQPRLSMTTIPQDPHEPFINEHHHPGIAETWQRTNHFAQQSDLFQNVWRCIMKPREAPSTNDRQALPTGARPISRSTLERMPVQVPDIEAIQRDGFAAFHRDAMLLSIHDWVLTNTTRS
jgi:hypothetical protein